MNFYLRRHLLAVGLGLGICARAWATGFYGPNEFLAQGGSNALSSPEFYWDVEVKRLAKDYHPTEKPFPIPRTRGTNDYGVIDQKPLIQATSDADAKDFADALKTGEVKPADPQAATQQHTAARNVIAGLATASIPQNAPDDGTPAASPSPAPAAAAPPTPDLPAEADSEFADYDRGAYAFRLGKAHYSEAQAAWEALLKRPAAERHYRTVWAAFMLGKLALKQDDPAAVTWFQQVRQNAKDGFADSLGMAADSYGWEARSEWKQGHSDKAAPLFLTQLALGDESAVVSLKALIPDRDEVDGMMNFGPDEPDSATPTPTPSPAATAADNAKVLAALKVMADDPLLRRLETVHILAVEVSPPQSGLDNSDKSRLTRWLKVIQGENLSKMDDAEYLGWTAYGLGDYTAAEHWLKLSSGTSSAAKWLDAKLKLRAGDVDGAAKDLAEVIGPLEEDAYTGWSSGPYKDTGDDIYIYRGDSDGMAWKNDEWASGDLGAVQLARGDFIQALDVLLKGGLWEDASYVAERVLTLDELKAYVDKMPPSPALTPTPAPGQPASTDESKPDPTAMMRYLLGRRMVREDRNTDALPYLPAPYDKVCEKYTAALKTADDATQPKETRAKAYFTAAWIARYDGLELMGTEVAPDSFFFSGDFQSTDLAAERLADEYKDASGNVHKNPLLATVAEKKRLKSNVIGPDLRWHYRYIAAALAIKSANLLEDNTEELADAVNTAGSWMKNLDEKKANAYFQIIEKRCAKTGIGKADITARWFTDQTGPLSDKEKADNDKLVPPAQ